MMRLACIFLTAGLLLSAPLAHADDRNLLPKYGSGAKADWQEAADKVFISGMSEDYHGDLKKASADMAARGWQYLSQGDLDGAMRRFNQAWLLNNNNGIALWGMAAVEASRREMDESLKLFAEAEKFVGDQLNFSVDYAKAIGIAGAKHKDEAQLKDAFARFERIHQKAPENTKNLQNWAMTLFSIGKYPEAWQKVKLAETTPNKAELDPRFVAELESHMPRPQD